MTDDFRSPYEVEDNQNNTRESNNQESGNQSKVDSLVDNDVGAITVGSGGKKKSSAKTKVHKFLSRGLELWPTTRKQKIIGSSIIAAVIVLGGVGAYALNNMLKKEPDTTTITKQEPKKTAPSKLTGVEVDKEINERRIIGVMIENSPDARPQASLNEAGVVFEAIAEGGITRFLALHLESDPGYIGPVRSVRPYYAEWAAGFNAALAHAGGSAQGLQRLKQLKVPDLDYTIAGGAYSRSSDRFAPHNLYTSMDKLRSEAKRLGFGAEKKFKGLERKLKEAPASGTPKAAKLNFSISGSLYDTSYVYDAKSNTYKRKLAGVAHRDHRSGKQIAPKVVIAMAMKYSQNGIYSVYKTTGKGQAIIFQDGEAIKATWTRKDAKSAIKFVDKNGEPIRLNPGQTWITALKNAGEVKYGP